MKVFVAFDGDEVIGIFDSADKARVRLIENGFHHYPAGHPEKERLSLWGAEWLKEKTLVNGQKEWKRGYLAEYEVE